MAQNTNRALAVTAVLGLAGVAAAFFFAGWERFWANWILWFLFLLTIGLGCLFLVALEHTVGARWSIPLRRVPGTAFQPRAPDGARGAACAVLIAVPVSVDESRDA